MENVRIWEDDVNNVRPLQEKLVSRAGASGLMLFLRLPGMEIFNPRSSDPSLATELFAARTA